MVKFIEFTGKKGNLNGPDDNEKKFVNLDKISKIYSDVRNFTVIEMENGEKIVVCEDQSEVLKRVRNGTRRR